jgi:hypothetical protein
MSNVQADENNYHVVKLDEKDLLDNFDFTNIKKIWSMNGWWSRFDMILAAIPMAYIYSQIFEAIYTQGSHFWNDTTNPNDSLNAFDMMTFATDLCIFMQNVLIVLVFTAVCFNTTNMAKIWRKQFWFLGGSMAGGGLVPKPSAISLGILLFLSSVVVQQRVVGGKGLMQNLFIEHSMAPDEWCRADVVDIAHPGKPAAWFSRMKREFPTGCFQGAKYPASIATKNNMYCGDWHSVEQNEVPWKFNRFFKDGCAPPNLQSPYKIGSHDTWNQIDAYTFHHAVATFWDTVPFIGHDIAKVLEEKIPHEVMNNRTIDTGYTCSYQCVKWKNLCFKDFVSNVGTILAGSAVITKLTESLTSRLGLQRVNADIKTSDLRKILEVTGNPRSFRPRSCAACAWILVTIKFLSNVIAYKVDDFGWYTVDFYVTMTLLFSALTALVFRNINPFRLKRIAYTDGMWVNGHEDFMLPPDLTQLKPGHGAMVAKKVQIHILLWLHMNLVERNYLLIMHARQISHKRAAPGEKVECLVGFEQEQLLPKGAAGRSASQSDQKNVRQLFSRQLNIQVGDLGTIAEMHADHVVVIWKDAQESNASDEPGEEGFWNVMPKKTKVPFESLCDAGTKWDNLIKQYVGGPKIVAIVQKNILLKAKVQDMVAAKKGPSHYFKYWVSLLCAAPNAGVDEDGEERLTRSAAWANFLFLVTCRICGYETPPSPMTHNTQLTESLLPKEPLPPPPTPKTPNPRSGVRGEP